MIFNLYCQTFILRCHEGLPMFKKHVSDSRRYGAHEVYGGMAGFVINPNAEKYARSKGLVLLKKEGRHIRELTENDQILPV